jgi:hypothetical protein
MLLVAALAFGTLAWGCQSAPTLPRPRPEPSARLTEPRSLCVRPDPTEPCLRANEVEAWLQDPDLEILDVDDTPAGIQGTEVLTLRAPSDDGPVVFRAKWRTRGGDDTRRELAAYVIQKMFLAPHEYVVPPSSGHCFALGHYRERVDPEAEPSFPGVECVFGILQLWLEDVQTMPEAEEAGWFDWDEDGLYDPHLWEESRIYRDSLAHVNILAYLIGHSDTHWAQFLIAEDPTAPVVYSVDNNMAFGANENSDLEAHDWSQIKVPALPRESVERLRAMVDRLDRLAILEQHARSDGTLVEESPSPPAGPQDRGYDWVDGKVKVRLVQPELHGLRVRLLRLLDLVDRGEIPLY